jgi:Lipopolysaccharide-assembly
MGTHLRLSAAVCSRVTRQFRRAVPERSLNGLARASVCVAIIVAMLPLGGCGYSLSGRGSFLPAYIKTIGVPMFKNHTSVFDVEQKVTSKVQAELVGRGHYTVLPEATGVDAVLSGEITAINIAASGFTQQQQTSRFTVTLVAKVELRELKTNKVLWANPAMQFSDQFEPTTASSALDASAFLRQDANALERLATEFARAVVSAMLEAF